jgi:hypothetical protein
MIDNQQFKELIKKGYSLDLIYLLQHLDIIDEICEESVKLQTLKTTLIRKGLISNENKVTLEGKQLLDFISLPGTKLMKVKKDDLFAKWWTAYPSTDSFTYRNRKFVGSRALRVKKDDCKERINKILNEGEYSIEDLIRALELEVHQKKEKSFKEGKNILSYMQNSSTYLHQRTFEAYIELYKQGHKVEEKLSNETYI